MSGVVRVREENTAPVQEQETQGKAKRTVWVGSPCGDPGEGRDAESGGTVL